MSEPINHGIVERLERLEAANGILQQECRRWRRGSLAAAAAVVILGITGAGVAARIAPMLEANEFVLRDKDGKARAALAIRDKDGSPGLAFLDHKGQVRLSFDLGSRDVEGSDDAKAKDRPPLRETPGVNIYDEDGGLRAALTIRPDGTPGLGLFDKDGQPRLSLDLCTDGSAGLNLYGEAAALRAALAVRPDGSPGLGLFNKQGQVVQSIDLAPDDRSAVH
ncbi:hypothetical protein [Paludisphaera borealis]|uniref:Uncharacterized protein n=1 Tax=Paludisphaera borealis TaxID=1387353 RepID=A0A1U7CRV1_9BACT|nr:hypothetical protein [Paludisphaera borealis]APW61619.1 hypothetical protein BSF38_03141 [Paludisphaera borealis]